VKRCKKACLLWTPAGDGDAAALAAIRREARADGIPLPADEDELNFDED
jgi:hypothetical protein